MPVISSTIRPAPGADGPYFVVTEKDGAVSNVTTGSANINAALSQVTADQGAVLAGDTIVAVVIRTTTVTP